MLRSVRYDLEIFRNAKTKYTVVQRFSKITTNFNVDSSYEINYVLKINLGIFDYILEINTFV